MRRSLLDAQKLGQDSNAWTRSVGQSYSKVQKKGNEKEWGHGRHDGKGHAHNWSQGGHGQVKENGHRNYHDWDQRGYGVNNYGVEKEHAMKQYDMELGGHVNYGYVHKDNKQEESIFVSKNKWFPRLKR